ncbi:MAG: DUF4097 family beta strand repeat-containing protein [Eubacterium sp.]|nr:DUF4097 family beta strand repeat-containing protein [Eubacterium sp.]
METSTKYRNRRSWGLEDVISYLKFARRHARMVAGAVFLCIFAPYTSSVLEAVLKRGLPREAGDVIGGSAFFFCIAGAVALFILSAHLTKRYGKVNKDAIFLDGGAKMEMEMSTDEWSGRRIGCIVGGVVTIILGPVFSNLSDIIPGMAGEIMSNAVLLFVAVGVALLVYAGSVSERLKELSKGCKRAASLGPEAVGGAGDAGETAEPDAGATDAGATDAGADGAAEAAGSAGSAGATAGNGAYTAAPAYTYQQKKSLPTWALILIIVAAFLVINNGFNLFRGFRLFSGVGGFHLFGPIKTSHYEGERSFDVNQFNKIDVNLKQSDLTIEETEGNEVTVVYKGDFYGEPKIQQGGSDLTISEESGFHLFGFHFGGDDGRITIRVPKKVRMTYDLDTSTGDVKINGTGEIEMDKLDLDVSTGGVDLRGIRAGEMDVDLSTGDLTITNVICTGETVLDSSTGNVTVVKSDLYRVDADLSMGDFSYELPEPKADIADRYEVDLDVSLGDVRFGDEMSDNDLEHGPRRQSDENRYFHVDVSMGDIVIR